LEVRVLFVKQFFQKFFTTYPELQGVYDDPGVFFKDLVVKEKTIHYVPPSAYVCVCEQWFVETVCLLCVDECGRPVVSENNRGDVNYWTWFPVPVYWNPQCVALSAFLGALFPLETVLEMQ
jgi:hypothetical protein